MLFFVHNEREGFCMHHMRCSALCHSLNLCDLMNRLDVMKRAAFSRFCNKLKFSLKFSLNTNESFKMI